MVEVRIDGRKHLFSVWELEGIKDEEVLAVRFIVCAKEDAENAQHEMLHWRDQFTSVRLYRYDITDKSSELVSVIFKSEMAE